MLTLLPWVQWLEDDPARYGPLAAEYAEHAGLRQVLPEIRALLGANRHPTLIRLIGQLRDEDAVPLLAECVEANDAERGPWAVAALGAIGGARAREVLRVLVDANHAWVRHAYRALAECRDEDDLVRFRGGLDHDDWHVRLVCVTVLGLARRPEDRQRLVDMTTDSVEAVADRARRLHPR